MENVLVSTSIVTHKFYPNSIEDEYDNTAIDIKKSEFANIVNSGNNVLVGKNIKIGNNCVIGHNSIIEKNVQIGNNCKIGSNTIIRNSIIKAISRPTCSDCYGSNAMDCTGNQGVRMLAVTVNG